MSDLDNKFPVLRANKYQHCPRFVRWDLLNPHRALDNHSQTLQRLSERGGLSPLELMANLNDEPFDYRKAELKDAKVKAVARLQKIAWSEDHPTIESLQATIKELEEKLAALALIDSVRLAELFHTLYEKLAPDFNYKTREKSAVDWIDVPEDNKSLMIAVAAKILDRLRLTQLGE